MSLSLNFAVKKLIIKYLYTYLQVYIVVAPFCFFVPDLFILISSLNLQRPLPLLYYQILLGLGSSVIHFLGIFQTFLISYFKFICYSLSLVDSFIVFLILFSLDFGQLLLRNPFSYPVFLFIFIHEILI